MKPLIPKIDKRLIIVWLFVTLFILIISGGDWELAFLPTLGMVVLLGFRFFVANLNGNKYETIAAQSFSSPDSIITAKIEYIRFKSKNLSPKVKTFYRYLVKRNYQEGAFVQEEEFESLDLASDWLEKAGMVHCKPNHLYKFSSVAAISNRVYSGAIGNRGYETVKIVLLATKL